MDSDFNMNPLFAGRALVPHSPSPAPEEPPKRSSRPTIHPTTARLIGELGVRFKPSAQADLEDHAESLRFLMEDVADVPPSLLEAACREHARTSRFMPKAAELIDLARQIQVRGMKGTDSAADQLQAHCDRLNGISGGRDGWHVVGVAPNRTIAKSRERMEVPS